MNVLNSIPLVDFTTGMVTTIISIVVCFAIIVAIIMYIKNSKKRKNMVHNKEAKNDNPENRG